MLPLYLKVFSYVWLVVGLSIATVPPDIVDTTDRFDLDDDYKDYDLSNSSTTDSSTTIITPSPVTTTPPPNDVIDCASVKTTYNSCNFNHVVIINSSSPCIFNCTYNPTLLSPLRLEVHLSYKHSSKHPTFVTAEQDFFMSSWTLPKMFPNHAQYQKYTSVEGLLCPPLQEYNETVVVRITTSSHENANMTVKLSNQSYALKMGDTVTVKASPISPDYRLYQWTGEQTSVLIVAESVDSSEGVCAIFAIQNAKCPVVTDESGLRAGNGRYQTFTSQAGMVASRNDFPDGIHMIVLPMPDDDRCSLATEGLNNHTSRHKSVKFQVFNHSTIESTWYIFLATGGMTVGLICGIAMLTLRCISRKLDEASYGGPLHEDERELLPEDEYSETTRGGYAEGGIAFLSGVNNGPNVLGTGSGSGYSQAVGPPEMPAEQSAARGLSLSFQSESDTPSGPASREIVHRPYYPPPTTVAPRNDYIQTMTSADNPVYVIWWKKYAYFESKTAEAQVSEMGFQHNVLIMAIFAMLPTSELIRSYLKMLSYNGDEDQCFFNSRCLTGVWIFHDFSRVFTNIGYIFGGFAFIRIVFRHKQLTLRNLSQLPFKNHVGVSRHYGLFVSLGYGLVAQGLMSSLYHTCPNSVTIRFDMMFMYVIVVAAVICVWGLRHGDVTHHVYPTMGLIGTMLLLAEGREWVSRLTFWLCMSFLYLFLVLTTTVLMSRFGMWSFSPVKMLQVWKGWKPVLDKLNQVVRDADRSSKPIHVLRIVSGVIANGTLLLYGAVADPNVYGYILSICLTNLGLYFANYIVAKRFQYKEKGVRLAWINLALSCIFWILAISAFSYSSTDSEASASDSRALNSSCAFLGVFDTHDVWHIFSSLALFTFFIGLLTLDDDVTQIPSKDLHVF